MTTTDPTRADRLDVIARAMKHMTTTEPEKLLAQLARTPMHDHIKADPPAILRRLREATEHSPIRDFYPAYRAAWYVLQAADADTN